MNAIWKAEVFYYFYQVVFLLVGSIKAVGAHTHSSGNSAYNQR